MVDYSLSYTRMDHSLFHSDEGYSELRKGNEIH